MSEINDRYNNLTRGKSNELNITPVAHLPKLSDKDYLKGYVSRYFVQKVNDESSPIYEVSATEFRKFVTSPLYSVTYLKWRISGPLTEQKVGAGEVVDPGVPESNRRAINLASTIITKLRLYLPNLKQFYKL